MNYVTTTELSKKWKISSRTIASYCEAGRIEGVIKKGMAWLIPENAQKPIDKRKSTSKVARMVVSINDNITEKGRASIVNKAEIDSYDTIYSPSDIKTLGFSYDTLRYYEKIGLVDPKRNIENGYREFDVADLHNLLTIDFHKKRGFNLHEIKKLIKQSNHVDTLAAFAKKIVEIEQNMYEQQCILNRLKEAKKFAEYSLVANGSFEIRDFPLYSVLKSFDNQWDFSKYSDDNMLRALNGEDILSHAVRAVSFNNTGFTGSTICVVKKATGENNQEQFLESGKCMYTGLPVITKQDQVSFAEKMLTTAFKWATEHDIELKGMAYGFTSFYVLGITKEQFLEIWFPIK